MAPQMIGQYEVLGVLGEGGMGQVLHAMDRKMGQEVVLKVINPALLGSTSVAQRSQRELQALVALRGHPNIVTVFDYVEEPFAIVMEFLRGETLAERISRGLGPLPTETIHRYGKAVLSALDYAHKRGLLHRDVKPANVMIVGYGSQEVVKVMDFGLAGFVGQASGLTRTGTRMGTPAYMAPEQHLGRATDERSDIYSFGIMLFEMSTGQLPFPESLGSDYQVAQAHVERPVPRASSLNSALPASLDAIIARCMAKEPERRYSSCLEVLGDLERAEKGNAVAEFGPTSQVSPGAVNLQIDRTRLETLADGQHTASGTKRCPACAEVILVDAKKCKHCGEFLDGRSVHLVSQFQGVAIPPVPKVAMAPVEPAFVSWCQQRRRELGTRIARRTFGLWIASFAAWSVLVGLAIMIAIEEIVGRRSGIPGMMSPTPSPAPALLGILVGGVIAFLALGKVLSKPINRLSMAPIKDLNLILMRAKSGRSALERLSAKRDPSFPQFDSKEVELYFLQPRRCPSCLLPFLPGTPEKGFLMCLTCHTWTEHSG